METRREWAGAGALTAAAGAVTGYATAEVLQLPVDPVVAVSEAVRDLTPGGLAVRLVHLVGHLDKPLLLAGTVLGLLGLGAVCGLLARRSATYGTVGFGVLAALGLAAMLLRPDVGQSGVLPVAVGLVTWWGVLGLLRAPKPQADRRSFLLRGGLVVVGTAGAGLAGWLLGRRRAIVEEARSLLRVPLARGAQPAGTGLDVPGLGPWRTPNADFYLIHTTLQLPTIAPDDYELRIHGLVDRELRLTYEDLVARRRHDAWITLCCVSNEVGGDLIGNAYWSGIPVRALLEEAGVSPDADAVRQVSEDGWDCATPLTALTDDRNALLAIGMNGRPLPVEHGFPVRMVVPGLYGYVSATKWLVELEVTRFDRVSAYWTERGWSERGPVKTQSRIDVPRPNATVEPGRTPIGGVAWAQHRGIARVEYQLDGGEWQPARLGEGVDDDTWVQWTADVDLAAGDHVLVVRATDKDGDTQSAVRRGVLPDGATGWHTVEFDARD